MRCCRKYFLILLILLCNNASFPDTSQQLSDYVISQGKKNLNTFWHEYFPYMYYKYITNVRELTGLETKLLNFIKQKINVNIRANEKNLPLSDKLNLLKEGKIDFLLGMNYYKELDDYVYYSVPYRMKNMSLFKLKDNNYNLSFTNIEELLAQIRLYDYKIGILSHYHFSSFNNPILVKFFNDPNNNDILIKFSTYDKVIKALFNKEIDYFIASNLTINTIMFMEKQMQSIEAMNIKIQAPVYFAFNKKNVSYTTVKNFNDIIESKEFKDILKSETKRYLYPTLLLRILKSSWFYVLLIIAVITFAISGVMKASKAKSSIFTSFLLAILPSSVGVMLYDIVVNSQKNLSISHYIPYLYFTVITVLIVFSSIKLLNSCSSWDSKLPLLNKLFDNIIIVCDSIGQSVIIIVAIAFAIVNRAVPLSVFVPVYAFLITYGGIFLRDVIINKDPLGTISKTIHAEIPIILGIIFAQLIYYYDFDYLQFQYLVIITICSFFTIRMLIHYLKIPNLRF